MATATTPRAVIFRDGNFYNNVPLAASVNVPSGTVGALDTSGRAGPSSNATYNNIIGVVEEGADNSSGAAGAQVCQIRRNIVATFENSSTAAVTTSHIGQTVKWEDNQTVCAPATASLPAGGKIMSVSATDGVEIYFP